MMKTHTLLILALFLAGCASPDGHRRTLPKPLILKQSEIAGQYEALARYGDYIRLELNSDGTGTCFSHVSPLSNDFEIGIRSVKVFPLEWVIRTRCSPGEIEINTTGGPWRRLFLGRARVIEPPQSTRHCGALDLEEIFLESSRSYLLIRTDILEETRERIEKAGQQPAAQLQSEGAPSD